MGFTPFQAFIKGGADYNNKVNLMRLQGEQDLRKVRATATAKALADSAGSTRSFTAGNISLMFTASGEKDKQARNSANIANFYDVLGTDKYAQFVKNANAMGAKGAEKLSQLNTYGKRMHENWIDDNKFVEGNDKTAKLVKYKDITGMYKQSLGKGYGKDFITNIVAPAYQVNYSRFAAKYPGKLGMQSKKTLDSDGMISYDHIPYLTKEVYDSPEGKEIVKKAREVGKNENRSYVEVLSDWQIGTNKDDRANVTKQRVIWDIYSDLKASLGSEGITDLNNASSYYKFIASARRKAYDNQITGTQFANILKQFVPNIGAKKESDGYIYADKTTRAELQLLNDRKHLMREYNIDGEAAINKRRGANEASGIATAMIKQINQGKLQVGPGTSNPLVSKLAGTIEGFFGPTGVFAGLGSYSTWLSGGTGIEKSMASRSRLSTKLNALTEDMKLGDKPAARRARIEFMKFNLAYTMASAFQGGTGGRTISDQDIENMMNAMKFDASSSEDTIIASLNTIRGIMQDVSVIQGMYAQGGKSAAVGFLLENTNAQFGTDFVGDGNLADYAAARLNKKKANPNYNTQYKNIKNPNFGQANPDGTTDNRKRIIVPK